VFICGFQAEKGFLTLARSAGTTPCRLEIGDTAGCRKPALQVGGCRLLSMPLAIRAVIYFPFLRC